MGNNVFTAQLLLFSCHVYLSMSENHLPISANKLLFFSLLTIIIAVLASSSLSTLLREQHAFAASDGSGSGDGGGGY
jgi:hypothetical protein